MDKIKFKWLDKTKLKWPIWFPYPSSWIRTAVLIPLFPLGMASSLLTIVAFVILVNPDALNISGLISLVTLAILFLCGYIYALAHHKIVRKQKRWNPTLLSVRKGFYSMLVLTFSFIPFWVLSFLFAERKYYYRSYGEVVLDSLRNSGYASRIEIQDSIAQIALTLFFVIAAMLFQFELILSQYLEKERQKQLKKKREKEEIAKEMEQMKAEIDRKKKERFAKCKKTTWVSRNKKHKK